MLFSCYRCAFCPECKAMAEIRASLIRNSFLFNPDRAKIVFETVGMACYRWTSIEQLERKMRGDWKKNMKEMGEDE